MKGTDGIIRLSICLQSDSAATFDTWRQSEVARLQRDRRVLEKQSKAILKVCVKVCPCLLVKQRS
jgi:hypothetical protein